MSWYFLGGVSAYAIVPSARVTSKNPSPWTARSRLLPVLVSWPWVNILEVAATREPLPTSTPVGIRLPPPESVPEARGFW